MLLNYLKLSLRLLVRNPFFSIINTLGLSMGLAAFFVLWVYSTTELESDQFHKDHERIARIGMDLAFPEDSVTWGHRTFGVIRAFHAPMFAADFPQIEAYTRLVAQKEFRYDIMGHGDELIISLGEEQGERKLFKESHAIYADPNLFEFFDIPLISGAKESALSKANTVVLSKSSAVRYFGKNDPMGRILQVNDTSLLTVSGVFQDLPHNTHLEFDLVISSVGVEHKWHDLRYFPLATSYIRFKDATFMSDFLNNINRLKSKYFAQDSVVRPFAKFKFFLQPLKDVPFTSYSRDYFQVKSKLLLRILKGVSVLILVMAWINYTNLAVSRLLKRLKEVATRKMSGAGWPDFLKQFLLESALMHLLAVAVSLTIIQLFRQPLEVLFRLYVPAFASIGIQTWIIFITTLIVGIIGSALYPILMALSYNPRSLYIMAGRQSGVLSIQTLLTVTQYTTALVLILYAFIVYFQLDFIMHMDLGMERQDVIVVDAPIIKSENYLADFEHVMNKIRATAGVRECTYSSAVVGGSMMGRLFGMKHRSSDFFFQTTFAGGVDETYIPFYKIRLIEGRNFVSNERRDALIVSRHATERLGYRNPGDAVGEHVSASGETMQIVGVIDDFRYAPLIDVGETLSEKITGMGISMTYKNGVFTWDTPERISLRVDMDRLNEVMSEIRNQYTEIFQGNIFNWYFLDENINESYQSEVITRNQIMLFTLLAIGISCLGLVAMMTASVEEKTKEIGIRKVLGAGLQQIGIGLLTNVSRRVMIAIIISMPLAYYLANQYLQRYLERISLQWWHFATPVIILLVIMLATIFAILLRAARSNPVEALKYE